MQAVKVTNLKHQYGSNSALKGIDFEVKKGAFYGVVGPNGGGKSTTFKILSTLLRPTSGEVSIFGEDTLKKPDVIRHKLGVVFQSPALDKKLTCWENLSYQSKLYGLSGKKNQERMEMLLSTVGLKDRKGALAETLSGGLQRRLEIAKGLIHDPKLLLLDEPTTGLDPLARKDVWDYLNKLQQESGLTVMTTTHLLEEADNCEEILLLHEGNVVANGNPDALKREIGGDVISLESGNSTSLKESIEKKFNVVAQNVHHSIRIESPKGHELVGPIMEAFGREITSITVVRPTLEDLFILKTGHRFWQEKGAA